MKKLQTGISTNMDFIKAMKERGQDVKAEFPAETLRKQLDEVNEELKVTFESTNETVLAAVNEGEEPGPGPEPELPDLDLATFVEPSGSESFAVDNPILESKDETIVSEFFDKYLTEPYETDLTLKDVDGSILKGSFEKEEDYEAGIFKVNDEPKYRITVQLDTNSEMGDEYVVIYEPSVTELIEFKSAERMDVSGATAQDNPGIVENGDKYEVVKDENTILVTDEGLVPYIGGNIDEPKKWVGILVDLGVKVKGKEYNIEDVDYSDASRWGALNDTTFIMWLTTEKGGEYTFTNLEDKKDKITITVEFAE